ncbi:A-kinase anchor protein 8-like [Trichomycterus rosablanca]|uniref:A-kinase anchor protein 8-like n=1 Tax=Trichomycterus rosablanca TaxID=2290929 RepID=UPI002F3523D8
MDGRGFGSGFSSWGGGAKDPVGVKMNQQLRMYHQMEGGLRGGRNDRFDQYGSRSSAFSPRDSHRPGGFGYGDPWGDKDPYGGPGYGGPGWGPGQRSQPGGGRPGGSGYGRWQDSPMPSGGGRGGGPVKVPLLPDPCMYPERGYQPPASQFAGYHMANREFNPLRPPKRQRDGQRKRKKALAAANAAKMSKTESAGDDDKETGEEKPEQEKQEDKEHEEQEETEQDNEEKDDGTKPEAEEEGADSSTNEGTGTASKSKKPKRDGDKPGANGPSSRAMSLVTFACSVCKFRSVYADDMAEHLKSKFHREHFRFLASQMTKPTSDFLQAYLTNKYEKAEQRVKRMEDYSGTVCQLMKDMDLSRGIGMEHFMKKVEALYCAACDMYVPMQSTFIDLHLKSPDHNYNRKGLLEYSKRVGCSTARGILSHKFISGKHQSFLKGENPFGSNQDEPDHEDSAVTEGDQGDAEPKPEETPEEAGPSGEGGSESLGNGDEHEEEREEEEGGDAEEDDEEEEEDFEDGDEDEDEDDV